MQNFDLVKKYTIWIKVLPNIFSFLLSLGAAYYLHWQTKDLVWSLWISSLLLGYIIFISFAIKALYYTITQMPKNIIKTLISSAIMLLFFFIHFGGFHLGHAVFLNTFFNIGFFESMGSIFELSLWQIITNIYHHLITPYAYFIVAILIAERAFLQQIFKKPRKNATHKLDNSMMFYPYKNVIKMHIILIVFGMVFALGIESFIMTAIIYFIYFAPIKELKQVLQTIKNR